MANIKHRSIKEVIAILQSEGVPIETMKVEEIVFASLMLSNDVLLQKKLTRAKRPVLLKKEILSVQVTKESGMLGKLFLELHMEAIGNERITKIRRMGGTQLDLFSDPEVALQRFIADHCMYFDKRNYGKFVPPDQKRLIISSLNKKVA